MRVLKVLGNEMKVKVSPSFLEKAACPLSLKFQYVDSHERDFRVAAERGSAAHAAIADLTNICLKDGIQPNAITDELVRKSVDDNTDYRLLEEIPNILAWVTTWRDKYRLSGLMVGHEERLAIDEEFNECNWSDAAYRGIVDVADIKGSHCIITDYKSQPHILGQTDLDAHYQLTFYAWLFSKFYPFIKTFQVRIWYLRYGFLASTPRSKEQLDRFEEGLLMKVDKIMSIDNWSPIPGTHCKYCDHAGRCPVGRPDEDGEYEPIPEAIINDEQASHYGAELRVVEERRKRLSAALREYVKGSENPVMISEDYAFGYKAASSTFYPPADVLRVLRQHGVDASEYATFSATSMKKLVKSAKRDDPKLFSDLEDVAMHKARTQFEGYEVKQR